MPRDPDELGPDSEQFAHVLDVGATLEPADFERIDPPAELWDSIAARLDEPVGDDVIDLSPQIEETGNANLYLTFGGLMHATSTGRPARAPLFLLPVKVTGGSGRSPFRIVVDTSGTSTPNYCLVEWLRLKHSVSIPSLETPPLDESGIDIDAAASRGIDQIRPPGQHRNGIRIQNVLSLCRSRAMDAHDLDAGEHLLQRFAPGDTDGLVHPIHSIGIIEQHIQPQGFGPLSHSNPDSPEVL